MPLPFHPSDSGLTRLQLASSPFIPSDPQISRFQLTFSPIYLSDLDPSVLLATCVRLRVPSIAIRFPLFFALSGCSNQSPIHHSRRFCSGGTPSRVWCSLVFPGAWFNYSIGAVKVNRFSQQSAFFHLIFVHNHYKSRKAVVSRVSA